MSTAVHPGDAMSGRQRVITIVMLGALVGLGPFTIDLYLPAFPAIVRDLDTSDAAIQLTLTATTIGFGVGQLLVGPWSDRIGRRIPLLIATGVHVLASLGVAFAPTVELVGLFRVLQGMGAAGGGVVAMAMVRDLFSGRALVRMLSRLALVTGLAPILAPLIGSQLLRVIDWRGVFVVLACYGVVAVIAASFLVRETRPRDAADRPRTTARERYRRLFGDRVFVGVALMGGLQFSALFAYLSSSSFLFQNVYGLSAQQFGLLFGINSLGLAVGVQTAARVMRRVGPQWLLAVAGGVALLSSVGIGIVALVGGTAPWTMWAVIVGLFIVLASFGFLFPSVQVLALAFHGEESGTAASVLGALNFGLAGILSPIVGLLGITSALPMAAVMVVMLALAQSVLWIVVRPRNVPEIRTQASPIIET